MAILVLNSGGKVGSEVVRALHREGMPFIAASSDPERSQRAWDFKLSQVRFSYDDPGSQSMALEALFAAGRNTDARGDTGTSAGLFLIHPLDKPGRDTEIVDFLKMAEEAGVRDVVYMSALGADRRQDSGIYNVEKHLATSWLNYAVLYPNWFLQNFNTGEDLESIRGEGTIRLASGDAKFALIDVRDIADSVVVLMRQGFSKGTKLTLTGSESFSYSEVAAKISRAAGYPVTHDSPDQEEEIHRLIVENNDKEFVDLYRWLYEDMRDGTTERVSTDLPNLLGQAPRGVDAFVAEYADLWKR